MHTNEHRRSILTSSVIEKKDYTVPNGEVGTIRRVRPRPPYEALDSAEFDSLC